MKYASEIRDTTVNETKNESCGFLSISLRTYGTSLNGKLKEAEGKAIYSNSGNTKKRKTFTGISSLDQLSKREVLYSNTRRT